MTLDEFMGFLERTIRKLRKNPKMADPYWLAVTGLLGAIARKEGFLSEGETGYLMEVAKSTPMVECRSHCRSYLLKLHKSEYANQPWARHLLKFFRELET